MSTTGYGPYVYGAGAGLEAFAQIAQGIQAAKRAKAVANYNAEVTEANARAASQAAEIEAQQLVRQAAIAQQDVLLLEQGQAYREARLREQHERILGQTRAIVASSGIMMSGSPLRVYEESVRQQEMDLLTTRYQSRLQVRAAQEAGTQAEYQAALARYGGAERLRIGKQQAGAIRAMQDDTQVMAGLLRASGTAARGAATYQYLQERQKPVGLLGGED